jgi:hypothetical protein
MTAQVRDSAVRRKGVSRLADHSVGYKLDTTLTPAVDPSDKVAFRGRRRNLDSKPGIDVGLHLKTAVSQAENVSINQR